MDFHPSIGKNGSLFQNLSTQSLKVIWVNTDLGPIDSNPTVLSSEKVLLNTYLLWETKC